ncbi:MAG: hypothetical protein KBT10_06585 [Bacteroidales bacterium]|nr:hypothetical protein [Candidatus Sodaliphilus aphodohippi]
MKKKFLLFLIAALPALAFATNGTWQGTGTVNDPYRIADLADLKVLIPDDGNSNYQDKFFVLTGDIADDGTLCPIGSNGKAFEGTFEGDGHTITLNMNNSASRDALFDCLGGKGVIRNVIVAGSVYGSASTHDEVAGICAWNYGIIDHCHNMAQATENNCTMGCAGICTKNYGTIINCWNSGTITSSESSSGGIVSKNYGIIKNCYNSGEISGNEACGIANSSPGPTLVNCYNSGSLSGRWLRPIISIGKCDRCYYEEGDFNTDYGTSLNASQMTDGTLLDYLNAYASTDSTLMTWVANGQGYPGFAPFHTHTFATEWSHDSISHWHAASCHDGSTCSWARSDNAPHQWSSNKPVDGEAYYTCQVCGYQDNERKTIAVTLVNVTCTLGDQATFAFKAIAGQASTVDITPAQG